MKKLLFTVCISACMSYANAQGSLNIGVQFGAIANLSKFKGGMADANALFTHNPYGSAQIGVYVRKAISQHFSIQTGFDFAEFGFAYSLAQDYSLMREEEHYAELRTGTCLSRVPVMAIYNSKLNCRNWRFIAGAGFSVEAIDNKWESESSQTIEGAQLGNTASSRMREETHSVTGVSGSFITLLGTEKVFRRGNMFNISLQGNFGFAPIAESTVTYMVNDKNYNHTFTNNGSWCSLAFSYYFLPTGSRKAANVK